MKEQEIIDLKFEVQHETPESSGSDTDWHYYTLGIGDICLITNANDEAVKDEWEASIFDFSSCVIKNIDDLKALVKIIKSNQR